jgi:hypothetical protein
VLGLFFEVSFFSAYLAFLSFDLFYVETSYFSLSSFPTVYLLLEFGFLSAVLGLAELYLAYVLVFFLLPFNSGYAAFLGFSSVTLFYCFTFLILSF